MAKRWYVVHVFSGSEKKMAQSILEQAETHGLDEQIVDVMVPTEEVVEVRKGKKKVSTRKFFPGYILISVDMNQDIWYMIKNTPKVTGFLGGSSEPVPLSGEEVKTIMEQIKGESTRPKPKVSFEKGENVIILPAVKDDEAKKLFPDGWDAIKPYLRKVPDPTK